MRDRRPGPPLDEADAPATEEELAAAARLREDLETGAPDDVVGTLRAAWSPSALDEDAHAELVDAALTASGPRELLDEPATAEEVARSAELRAALDEAPGAGDELLGALRAAYRPRAMDDAEHARVVEAAIADGRGQVVPLRRRPARVAIAAGAVALSLAAGVVLWMPTEVEAPLARARSTQPLFDEPFKAGEASARIDRIALARGADYRDNRFVMWGVK